MRGVPWKIVQGLCKQILTVTSYLHILNIINSKSMLENYQNSNRDKVPHFTCHIKLHIHIVSIIFFFSNSIFQVLQIYHFSIMLHSKTFLYFLWINLSFFYCRYQKILRFCTHLIHFFCSFFVQGLRF